MLALTGDRRIWLCTQPTDMRRSFDGLAAQVKAMLKEVPDDGSLYVFINKRRNQMKCLYFEPGGYCLWGKRLETGRFRGAGSSVDIKQIVTHTEFLSLLEGLDMTIKRRRKRYIRAA